MLGKLKRLLGFGGRSSAASSGAAPAVDSAAQQVDLGNRRKLAWQPVEALACFKNAIATDPQNAEAFAGAGSVLLQLARNDEARRHLSQALDLNPELPEAQWNLMHALLMDGYYATGFALHEKRFWIGRL